MRTKTKRVRREVWRGDRGEGTVFYFVDPATGAQISRNLYLSYRAGGREVLVSAKTDDVGDAKRELRRLTRNRENAREGKEALVTPKTERVTVSDLLNANLRRLAEEKHGEPLGDEKYRTETLRALLGGVRAVEFGPGHVDTYKERRRRGEGTARRTKVGETSIRRELEILNAAFQYAVRRRQLRYAPYIEKPTEDRVREQEIPLEKFPAILSAIACPDARDFCEWLLLTATRPKGVGRLRWEWFDRETWTLSVPSEKGGNARAFAIEGTLRRVIERRLAARRLDCPFIFHRRGRPLGAKQVRPAFYAALEACGLEPGRAGYTLYDTKKTAAGLLIDSGLTEREAMHFSGHATTSMFDRYIVKSADRHREQVRKRDAYLERRLARAPGGRIG
ncbi:MAG: tyrosine-type recombinase/integrase [Acidobacteriota bacterium]|nr:tyrosine-type recombinase/integrase [Acidobacteriota bacterium]